MREGAMYDLRGNAEYEPSDTSYPRTRFYYNEDNLLKQVDDVVDAQTTNTTYLTWDADQQRLKLARGSDTWEMLYDPAAATPAVLLAKNYVSESTSYVFNVREPGGGLIASFDPGTASKYYHHYDALGSTVLISNGSGTASDSFTYGAWGEVLNSPPNNRKPYQYVGELGYYTHSTSQGSRLDDLMQLGVRFYDPDIGRFTQRDPILTASSMFAYANCAPTSAIDPTGYKGEWLYGDGQICVDSSCYRKSYFPAGIKNAPNYSGPAKPLPKAPKPCKGKKRQNCALTDGIVVPPKTTFDVDGCPQRPKTPPTDFLKISAGWTCTFTCNDKAKGNKIKLTCEIHTWIPGPGRYPPKWEDNPSF